MDFFDECVLVALKDGKPKDFTTLLGEVGFSHNTLQQHLDRLTAKGLVLREKLLQTVSEDPNLPIISHPRPQNRSLQHSKTLPWS